MTSYEAVARATQFLWFRENLNERQIAAIVVCLPQDTARIALDGLRFLARARRLSKGGLI